tara:strand:+ start:160 stop:1023 length:864 start_codon:yes stop_codon:yes gene_type:complete
MTLLYGEYKKPEILIKLEKFTEENSINLEMFGFFLDQSMPFAPQPIDMIPFATTGTDGTYFAFLTDFGRVKSLEEAPIIMYCGADFNYEEPSSSFTLFAKNIKDFLSISTQIYNPYFVYEADPRLTNFKNEVEELLEDEFEETEERTSIAKSLVKHLDLEVIENLNEYYSELMLQRHNKSEIKTKDGLNIIFEKLRGDYDKEIDDILGKEKLISSLSELNKSSRLKFYRDYGDVYRNLDKDEFHYVLEVIIKFLKEDNLPREAKVLEFDLNKKKNYNLYHKLKNNES